MENWRKIVVDWMQDVCKDVVDNEGYSTKEGCHDVIGHGGRHDVKEQGGCHGAQGGWEQFLGHQEIFLRAVYFFDRLAKGRHTQKGFFNGQTTYFGPPPPPSRA